MRKGLSISVSLGIGMAIFVITIASVFLMLQSSLYTSNQFAAQVDQVAQDTLNAFRLHTDWTIHRTPLIVDSSAATIVPLSWTTNIPSAANPNSVAVIHDGDDIPSYYDIDADRTAFVANVSAGINTFQLTYTTDSGLDAKTHTTDMQWYGSTVGNSRLNVTFTDTGITSLAWDGTELLESTADINVSTAPSILNGSVQTNITYDGGRRKEVFVYHGGTGQIDIENRFSEGDTWQFDVTDTMTHMYTSDTGSTRSLDATGTIYTGTTDMLDVNGTDGLAFIGNDLWANVSRSSLSGPVSIELNVTGGQTTYIRAHDGDYTAVQPVYKILLEDKRRSIGLPAERTGISRTKAAKLDSQSYDSVKDTLGISGAAYNISLPGIIDAGRPVNTGATVHAFSFPVTVVDRFGNATIKPFNLRVWNQ